MKIELQKRLGWFMVEQDPVPTRLHYSKVFARNGRPEWTREFQAYLFDSPNAVDHKWTVEPCTHEGQADPKRCDICGIIGEDGQVLVSSNIAKKQQVRYRHPMKRAMIKLRSGEDGKRLAGALLIYLRERGRGGVEAVAVELQLSQEESEDLLTKALARLQRYYKKEPIVAWFKRAREPKIVHNSTQPSRPVTPDRL